MSQLYRPELDVSPVLGADKANYYQNLIGILQWAVELGRIDIFAQVSMFIAISRSAQGGTFGSSVPYIWVSKGAWTI
jgi:hypothetical protein